METGALLLTRAWFPPRLRLPPHAHARASLAVVLRGGWTGELERRPTELRRRDSVVVTPSGARHSNAFGPQETEVLVVEVQDDSAHGVQEVRSLLSRPTTLQHRGLGGLAARLAAELRTPDDHSPLLSHGLALELLATAGRASLGERGVSRPAWLERARECLHQGLSRRWTLEALAGAAEVEPSRLVRGFRRHLRTTPADYLRQLRVQEARALLAGSERPVAEIALDLGFTDQSHLTRVFRRSFGETPAAFRTKAGRG
jgi:AraC family transcriptional regulator